MRKLIFGLLLLVSPALAQLGQNNHGTWWDESDDFMHYRMTFTACNITHTAEAHVGEWDDPRAVRADFYMATMHLLTLQDCWALLWDPEWTDPDDETSGTLPVVMLALPHAGGHSTLTAEWCWDHDGNVGTPPIKHYQSTPRAGNESMTAQATRHANGVKSAARIMIPVPCGG